MDLPCIELLGSHLSMTVGMVLWRQGGSRDELSQEDMKLHTIADEGTSQRQKTNSRSCRKEVLASPLDLSFSHCFPWSLGYSELVKWQMVATLHCLFLVQTLLPFCHMILYAHTQGFVVAEAGYRVSGQTSSLEEFPVWWGRLVDF